MSNQFPYALSATAVSKTYDTGVNQVVVLRDIQLQIAITRIEILATQLITIHVTLIRAALADIQVISEQDLQILKMATTKPQLLAGTKPFLLQFNKKISTF